MRRGCYRRAPVIGDRAGSARMPHVYNGCGTWYYGKGNRLQYSGTCRACNRAVTLSAYDTRLWFVLVMVPIIPLARKRIIDDCPSCRRHAAMPLDDWRRAQG